MTTTQPTGPRPASLRRRLHPQPVTPHELAEAAGTASREGLEQVIAMLRATTPARPAAA